AAGRSGNVHRIFRHTPGDRRRRGWRKEPPFATVGSRREAADPREGEVPNVGRVDLRERAVPTLRIVARVGRPRVGRGFGQQRGIHPLAHERPARHAERNQEKQPGGSCHFNVTRYAVRLWISESRHCGSMSICHCSGLVTTTLGIESCLAKLRYVPSGSLRATTKAEM